VSSVDGLRVLSAAVLGFSSAASGRFFASSKITFLKKLRSSVPEDGENKKKLALNLTIRRRKEPKNSSWQFLFNLLYLDPSFCF